VGLGISGFFLAAVGVLCFVYTLPAAVLSAIAAFPVAYALMQFTRAMADKWVDSFGGFYRTTWLGIFCYLTITAAVGIGFAIRYAPHTNLGIFSDLSVAISYLRLKPALLVAVFTPGLLACEAVWAHRIGRPLWGVKGFLTAIALSALCVPTALAAICWGAVTILG
jgi:hypothetical protein